MATGFIPRYVAVDVDGVDATESDVLYPKKIVKSDGSLVVGSIPSVEGGIIAPQKGNFVTAIEGGTYAKDRIQIAPIPDKYKDTTGANALASHVLEGIGFVGRNGVVEDGALLRYKNTAMAANVVNKTIDAVTIRTPFENPMYVDNALYCDVPFEQFGNADEWHVAEGYTFTSASGVKVEGKIPVYDYTPIEAEYSDETDEGFIFMGSVDSGALMEDEINLEVPKEQFGNATASDVRVGKTFTSSAGLKEDGTMPNVYLSDPTFTAQLDDDDDSGNTVWLRASVSQSAGYTQGGNKSTDIFPKLTVSGDTATMECGGVSISRKVGASIATCNVTVNFTINPGTTLTSATTFANGAISVYNSSANSGTITIPNVVCGSALSINTTSMCSLYTSASQQPHNTLLGGTVKVPATAGQTYTIEVGMIDD